jgi:antitoxin VapB
MESFSTRQFQAGNSQAVRIPADMAFPPKTQLVVRREGNRLIVEPLEQQLDDLPLLFAKLGSSYHGNRPEFIESERDW